MGKARRLVVNTDTKPPERLAFSPLRSTRPHDRCECRHRPSKAVAARAVRLAHQQVPLRDRVSVSLQLGQRLAFKVLTVVLGRPVRPEAYCRGIHRYGHVTLRGSCSVSLQEAVDNRVDKFEDAEWVEWTPDAAGHEMSCVIRATSTPPVLAIHNKRWAICQRFVEQADRCAPPQLVQGAE